jgi:peptidoglycan/LPS O-acetylase OafA/YrhL
VSPLDLLYASFAGYSKSFWRLAAIAGVGWLISNVLSAAVRPESTPWAFLVLLIALSVPVTFESAVMWTALRVRSGQPVTAASVLAALATYGPRYLGATLALGLVILLLLFTFVGWPLALFLWVRLALFGPAIVVEDMDIIEAYRRSWNLVRTRWWRTLGLYSLVTFVIMIPVGMATLVLMTTDNLLAVVAVWTIASAVSMPLATIFTLFLFEDYRRVTPRAQLPS